MCAALPPPAASPSEVRNLTGKLAAWLRGLGFVVVEKAASLEAVWRGPDELLYQVSYAYAPAAGTFQLLGSYRPTTNPLDFHGLVHKAEINRLREARFLLLSNAYYKEARRVALHAGTLKPAPLCR